MYDQLDGEVDVQPPAQDATRAEQPNLNRLPDQVDRKERGEGDGQMIDDDDSRLLPTNEGLHADTPGSQRDERIPKDPE